MERETDDSCCKGNVDYSPSSYAFNFIPDYTAQKHESDNFGVDGNNKWIVPTLF
jgi:hypothetical protein